MMFVCSKAYHSFDLLKVKNQNSLFNSTDSDTYLSRADLYVPVTLILKLFVSFCHCNFLSNIYVVQSHCLFYSKIKKLRSSIDVNFIIKKTQTGFTGYTFLSKKYYDV